MNTPRFDKAYKDCLDDAGKITRLEPLYRLCEVLESENQEAKVLIFKLAEEMERDGYETLPKKAKEWLNENGPAERTRLSS